MKPYDTVLFDLDGTLLNTLLGLTSALTHVFFSTPLPGTDTGNRPLWPRLRLYRPHGTDAARRITGTPCTVGTGIQRMVQFTLSRRYAPV